MTHRLRGVTPRELRIFLRTHRRTSLELVPPGSSLEAKGQGLVLQRAVLHRRPVHQVLALLVLVNHPLGARDWTGLDLMERLVGLPEMRVSAIGEERGGRDLRLRGLRRFG